MVAIDKCCKSLGQTEHKTYQCTSYCKTQYYTFSVATFMLWFCKVAPKMLPCLCYILSFAHKQLKPVTVYAYKQLTSQNH